MDDPNMTLEEKCEHLMNIVVESRKRFGKMCVDYDQKTSLIENKLLNLQVETIANYKFKSKAVTPLQDTGSMLKDIDNFVDEIKYKQNRIENLRKNVKNTQSIVLQLKEDKISNKLKKPLTAEAMLQTAKNKNKL